MAVRWHRPGDLDCDQRRYARNPGSLTGYMIKSFAAKMVCFALYVAVVIKSGAVQRFLCHQFHVLLYLLHLAEALGLHRLQSPGPGSCDIQKWIGIDDVVYSRSSGTWRSGRARRE